jgi:hypothetical protein
MSVFFIWSTAFFSILENFTEKTETPTMNGQLNHQRKRSPEL